MSTTAALSLAVVVLGCNESPPTQNLTLDVHTSGDTVFMDLSVSLHAIAQGALGADEVAADLEFGNDPNDALIHVGDVTTIDSLIVVLDRGADQIVTWSHQGELVSRLGREGEGPGEFRRPIAIATVSDHFVVFQPQLSNSLTILHRSGELRNTVSSPVEGDWSTMVLRGPHDYIEAPFDGGVEDRTRRLQRFDDTSFVFQLQSDELQHHSRVPDINLIRFDLDGRILDTIWARRAPLCIRVLSSPRTN